MKTIDKKKLFPILMLVLTLVVIVLVAHFLGELVADDPDVTSRVGAIEIEQSMNTIYIDGEPYTLRKGVSTLLLIGIDKDGAQTASGTYNNSDKSDFLALLVFDRNSESYTLLHINRDTMSDIPMLDIFGNKMNATKYGQLALAHTYGDGLSASCRNTADAVSTLLYDIKIENYICVTMSAIPVITDYIGGVTVTVPVDMTTVDPSFTEGATLKLTGTQALSFVRARGGLDDSSNLSRMERQKQYISAFVDAASSKTIDDEFVGNALDKISDYTVSSMTDTFMSTVTSMISSYTYNGAVSPKGDAVVGEKYMEFYVDEEDLKGIITDLFYDKVE